MLATLWGQRRVDSPPRSGQVNIEQVPLPNGNSWEDKHFKEALLRGRAYKEFYVLINEDKKVVKVESLIEYCKKHNYRWQEKYETKEIQKFGDMASSIYKFWFMPNQNYIEYVFDWTDRTSSNSNNLKQRGTVYFFNPTYNQFVRLDNNALWTSSVVDGYINGTGAGIWQQDNNTYYYFSGTFKNGFPVGKAKYRIVIADDKYSWGYSPREQLPSGKASNGAPFREVEVGEMHEGMATFRYLDNGEGRNPGRPNELYGYVNQNGNIVINPTYKAAFAFKNGRATVKNDKDEDVYIDKSGQITGYTEGQKRIFAAEKARQDSIKAAKERERLLAEQKAAEERRLAEAKEANLKRRIEANKNTRLWTRGCRLCYRYPNGYEYVLATLEEWNNDHTKVKVKIVASPSATRTLNGDLLEKNNTMWVSARNEGWHLALDEEITIALNNDNSMKRTEVYTSSSSSSGSGYSTCSRCRGAGMVQCYNCYGKGYVESSWSDERETCTTCGGRGRAVCYDCKGTGKK